MRLLIAVIVWIAAVAAAAELSSAVAGSIHTTPAAATTSSGTASSTGSGSGSASGSGAGSLDPSSVSAADAVSLFHTANFARALAAVRAHLGPSTRLAQLALYPGYLDLTAVRPGGEVNVYIAVDGRYEQNDTGGDPGTSPLLALARVSAHEPAALAARIATAGQVPAAQLNYMVAEADPTNGQFRWLVYPHQGNRVEYFETSGANGQLLEYLANSSTGPQPVR
jgi:hypothetical protein